VSENLKQVDRATSVLAVFEEHDEDMGDVRHVIHYFYGGNFEALRSSLIELGYQTRLTVNEDGVVAERHEAIGEDWRTSTLVHLCELADTYGVEYDGFEASMTRQEPRPKKKNGWLSKLLGVKG
jgi:hypothetical protein